MAKSTNANLRPDEDGTRWEDSSQGVRSTSDDDEATELFGECLQPFFAAGKPAKEVAWELGLSESHLSEMRAGKRSVTLVRLIRMCRRSQEAALVLGRRLAAVANLEGPRHKRKVSKREAERQLALELRTMGAVFEIARARAAAKLGTDESDFDDALSETTGVRQFAELSR